MSSLGEDSFFDALFRVMWDLETDIFAEPDRTLALLADIVPKCKKQRNRLRAMYDCGAMDYIEKAIADRKKYEHYLCQAVNAIVNGMNISSEKAVFSVNVIINLWNGELPEIDEYTEDEEVEEDVEEIVFDEDEDISTENEEDVDDDLIVNVLFPDSDTMHNDNKKNDKGGGEEMLFLQDVATDTQQGDEQNNNTPEQQSTDGDNGGSADTGKSGGDSSDSSDNGGGESTQQPRESVLSKLVNSWCRCSFEEGRPLMLACPVGWVILLLCSALGCFMVYDIPLGDKLVVPTFAFMFSVLTAKRHYRFESVGRFSILIAVFYLVAMFRSLWLGGAEFGYVCIIVDIAAMAIFNSGRIGDFLDGSKKRPGFAYTMIIMLSFIVTAGAYAVQNVTV